MSKDTAPVVARGTKVKLIEMPTGYLSSKAPVTVGNTYEVLEIIGSCYQVTTDVLGETATIYYGRFEILP